MTASPSFRCVGGSLFYREKHLTRDDMIAFRGLYREECDCAFKACLIGPSDDYERAVILLAQVVFALDQHDKWVAAQGPARRAA